ncbi:MAG: hypothetical protein ABI467_05725 [Kofleriaceae bacterium]
MKYLLPLPLVAACFSYSPLPAERAAPVLRKLADAKILDMKVNLHEQPGLCPGHPGKLYVDATVQWPGMEPVLRALGRDVDSLDPSKFSITGPLLRGDADANLIPSDDVQASDDAGFEAKVVYTLEPRWSFHEVFKPEYSCFSGWVIPGDGGAGGSGGYSGSSGSPGESGQHGSNGGPGARGGTGGHVTAYVTIVSTKFYAKLYAVIANGTFFLAPADRELTFAAIGGPGGAGGDGGNGGNGGSQRTESRDEYDDNNNKTTVQVGKGGAGNGGNGGSGGYGGDGGGGGTVEVIYDAAFPELRGMIATDVTGGAGGPGGNGGGAGAGGGSTADRDKQIGQDGQGGQGGSEGRAGVPGRANVRGGAVTSQFRGIRGIQIAGTSGRRR